MRYPPKAAVDGLAEQRDEVVADVAAGTAFLEIVGSNMGKAQGIIQLSNGQESGVGSDGGTVKLRVFPAVGAVAYPVEGVLHRDGVEVGERPSAVLVVVRPEAVVVDVGVLLADRAEGSLSAGIAQGIDV